MCFFLFSPVPKKLAIAINIDSGDLLLVIAFGQEVSAILQAMKPAGLYVIKAIEKPIGMYPSTFIELKTHFHLSKTKVSPLPASSLNATKLSKFMASFETHFMRISELVLDAGNTRVSFRGIVIKSCACKMPKGEAVRSFIVDESGQCIAFCQFNGKVMNIGSLVYCRLAQVYTDKNDHHIELSCVSVTYVASNLRLIDAPSELQSFYRVNDMTKMLAHHNRSSPEELEETTMIAMINKLESRYAIDAKTQEISQPLPSSSSAAPSSSCAAASSSSSSSSTSCVAYSPMDVVGINAHGIEHKHMMSGYVTLKLKRIIAGASLYYNACVHKSMSSWGESTCNKSVVRLIPGEDWMDHKDRAAGEHVHRSQSCLQRYMFTAVFEEEEEEANNVVVLSGTKAHINEYQYKVFDEFGTLLLGVDAPDFALLSNKLQVEVQNHLKNPAVYVVTISRNGVIENMQTTQCAGEIDKE